jgi:ribonuclease Z
MALQEKKMGLPLMIGENTVDSAHTVHYAVGYLMNEVQPRVGMITHMAFDEDLIPEIIAGVRVHYDGLFQLGCPDGVVVNVTKDAIWTRNAAFADDAMPARPSKSEANGLFDLGPTHTSVDFPNSKYTIMDVREEFVRDREIDPNLYYPADVNRDLVRVFPHGFKIKIPEMIGKKVGGRIKARFGGDDD